MVWTGGKGGPNSSAKLLENYVLDSNPSPLGMWKLCG